VKISYRTALAVALLLSAVLVALTAAAIVS
jgi:hypothetical protein